MTISDVNDHVPVFERDAYDVRVREDISEQSVLLSVSASDVDDGANGEVVYALAATTMDLYGDVFGLRSRSGELFLKRKLDFETTPTYQLIVTASDRGEDALTAEASVTVDVMDVNDFTPQISVNTLQESDVATVREHETPPAFVAFVIVTDHDGGDAGRIDCDDDSDLFRLEADGTSGKHFQVKTSAVFDREVKDEYEFAITCHDFGDPRLEKQQSVRVRVADVNDHDPQFAKSRYSLQIIENRAPSAILSLNASDADADDNARVEYFLSDANAAEVFETFAVEASTGLVSTLRPLDHERNQSVAFTVIALDGGDPPRSDTAAVAINVLDENDNAPEFARRNYRFRISEDAHDGAHVGEVIATDADAEPFNNIQFRLEPPEGRRGGL